MLLILKLSILRVPVRTNFIWFFIDKSECVRSGFENGLSLVEYSLLKTIRRCCWFRYRNSLFTWFRCLPAVNSIRSQQNQPDGVSLLQKTIGLCKWPGFHLLDYCALDVVGNRAARIDRSGIGVSIERYRSIAERVIFKGDFQWACTAHAHAVLRIKYPDDFAPNDPPQGTSCNGCARERHVRGVCVMVRFFFRQRFPLDSLRPAAEL